MLKITNVGMPIANRKKKEANKCKNITQPIKIPRYPAVQSEQFLAQIGATRRQPVQEKQKKKITPDEVRKIITDYIGDDVYKMYCYEELLNNIENLDYEHIEEHLENIKILLNCTANYPQGIIKNGYFYSEAGLKAFNILLDNYSTKHKSGCISPITVPLSDYIPEEVIKADERDLTPYLMNAGLSKELLQLSDEEFTVCRAEALKSIQNSGKTYGELCRELNFKLAPIIPHESSRETYFRSNVNEYTIIPNIAIIDFLEDYPVNVDRFYYSDLLHQVNINNYQAVRNILNKMRTRKDLSSQHVVQMARLINAKTAGTLTALIACEDIPLDKIIEYCSNDESFKKGSVSADEILGKISDDSLLNVTNKIKNSDIDISPANTTPVKLNPRDIKPEALVLVHMTDYEPENNVILSTRDKLGGSRNSVHFTLNHAVTEHRSGSWDKMKYAIIMPYETTIKSNSKRKFIEGMPNDLYTNGSVKVPEGSIMIKYDENLPKDYFKISESPSLKGVKVIETSQYPHDIVPAVIEKMGYTHLKGDGPVGLFSYGKNNGNTLPDAMENYKAWKRFCNSAGMKPIKHTGSPGGIAERIIESIGDLCVNGSWYDKGAYKDNNYKQDLLNVIVTLKKWQNKGYFVSYDLDKLADIIKESDTPSEAIQKIQSELGFHPTVESDYFSDSSFYTYKNMGIYEKWLEALESDKDSLIEECLEEELSCMA